MNLSTGLVSAHSVVSDSVTPWTVAPQAPLSMRFPRQEYWNGLPFPSPGDLPHPAIKPVSPPSPILAGGFFTTVPPERNRAPLVVQWLRRCTSNGRSEGLISVWRTNTLHAVWCSQKKKKYCYLSAISISTLNTESN